MSIKLQSKQKFRIKMKSFNLLFCMAFLCQISIAQEVTQSETILLHQNQGAKFNFVDIDYQEELSTLNLYTVSYFKKQSDNKYYPQLNNYVINTKDLSLIKKDSLINTVEKTIKEKHNIDPNFVEMISKDVKEFEVEVYWNNFTVTVRENGKTHSVNSEKPEVEGKLTLHPERLVNYEEKTFFAVYGDKKKGKEFKDSEFQDLTLVKHGTKGEILKSTDINLSYPRNLLSVIKISAPDMLDSEQKGFSKALLVFGEPKNLKKKDENPDILSNEVVGIDNQGNILFQHKFSVRDEKHSLAPAYAYETGGNIVLMTKLEGRDPALAQIVLNEQGLSKAETYTYQEINKDNETKLSLTYLKYFDVTKHTVLDNGNVILAGHAVEEVTETTAGNPDTGTPPSTTVKRVPYAFNIISFDANLKLKEHFASSTSQYTSPQIVDINGSKKLIFNVGSDPKVDFNLGQAVMKKELDSEENLVEVLSYKPASKTDSSPVIVSLDEGLAYYNLVEEDLFNINNETRYYVNNDGSITFVGLKGNSGVLIQNTDKWPVNAYLVKVKL